MSPVIMVLKEIERNLIDAKRVNDKCQERANPGSNQWHAHETIDDNLHDFDSVIEALIGQYEDMELQGDFL